MCGVSNNTLFAVVLWYEGTTRPVARPGGSCFGGKMTYVPNYPLVTYDRTINGNCVTFSSPSKAAKAGYKTANQWKKEGRQVKEDAVGAIVPLKLQVSQGLGLANNRIITYLQNDQYIVAANFLEYFKEEETEEKPLKKGRRNACHVPPPYVLQIRNRKRRCANTGVMINTPVDLTIPQEVEYLENEIRYVFHSAISQVWSNRHGEETGARLSSKLLEMMIGNPKRALDARKWLVDNGVLVTDHSYEPGSCCKTYHVPGKWRQCQRWEVTKTKLADKILLARSTRSDRRSIQSALDVLFGQKTDIENHLDNWLNRLNIDATACKALNDRWDLIEAVAAIESHDCETKRDQYGRYHSPVTRLFTPFRQHLHWDDRRTVSLDIKNSQLVIAGKLLKEHYLAAKQEPPADVVAFLGDVQAGTLYDGLFADAQGLTGYMLDRKAKELRRKKWNDGLLDFMGDSIRPQSRNEWAEAKARYHRANRLRDVVIGDVDPITRNDFKRLLFADCFFGSIYIDNPITRLFAAKYPSVWEWIKAKKKNDYRDFARDLQRSESALMIDCICARLMKYHPNLPITTVHDSIITTVDNAGLVERVMKEEYARVGLTIAIKRE
jgi:hypothetical protein